MAENKAKSMKSKIVKIPKEVNIAIYLYWFFYVISVLVLIKNGQMPLTIILVSSLIVLAFTYWVTKELKEGKQWMRTLVFISTLLNIIMSAKDTAQLDANALVSIMGSLVILFLLYTKKNNAFF